MASFSVQDADMRSTTLTDSPVTAASSVVDRRPSAPESLPVRLCSFCVEGVKYRPEDGPADVAVVWFDGTWACSFHALFHWREQPALAWKRGAL